MEKLYIKKIISIDAKSSKFCGLKNMCNVLAQRVCEEFDIVDKRIESCLGKVYRYFPGWRLYLHVPLPHTVQSKFPSSQKEYDDLQALCSDSTINQLSRKLCNDVTYDSMTIARDIFIYCYSKLSFVGTTTTDSIDRAYVNYKKESLFYGEFEHECDLIKLKNFAYRVASCCYTLNQLDEAEEWARVAIGVGMGRRVRGACILSSRFELMYPAYSGYAVEAGSSHEDGTAKMLWWESENLYRESFFPYIVLAKVMIAKDNFEEARIFIDATKKSSYSRRPRYVLLISRLKRMYARAIDGWEIIRWAPLSFEEECPRYEWRLWFEYQDSHRRFAENLNYMLKALPEYATVYIEMGDSAMKLFKSCVYV